MKWKKLLWLLLLSEVFALTHIFYPKSSLIEDGSVIYMGRVGFNHVLKIIIDGSYPDKITKVSTDPETNIIHAAGRYYVYYAPENIGPGGIKFYVEKNNITEVFTLSYDVSRSVLDVNIQPVVSIPEFSEGNLELFIFNHSLGSTSVRISCPRCESNDLTLNPLEPVKVNISVTTDLSGTYSVPLVVEDLRSRDRYNLRFLLVSVPTLNGRILAGSKFFDFLFPLLQPFKDIAGVIFWKISPRS